MTQSRIPPLDDPSHPSEKTATGTEEPSSSGPPPVPRSFSRPATPTTPFQPQNLTHQQLAQGGLPPPRPSETPATFVPSSAPPPLHAGVAPHSGTPMPPPLGSGTPPPPSAAVRADGGAAAARHRAAPHHMLRSRAYAFVVDERGLPIEVGSGRFAKAYLGEERWLESKTDFRRQVVIKILQKGVSEEDGMRFQMEKELLERVQGHPNIIRLFASGEGNEGDFIPASIRDQVEPEYVILERLDMSLEERLKGSRDRTQRDDLLACNMQGRIFRVLDYMIPIAAAVEHAHLIRNICHRDIKPANVLIGLPDTSLRGSLLEVRLADFNVAKLRDEEVSIQMTNLRSVPGTLFFQSPEQETNVLELLVNVETGSAEVEFFEDFYIQIAKNDTFSLFNRGEQYPVLYADRARKRIVLGRAYRGPTETNVRSRIQKSVGRPADIYSLGATFYYLISGAYANPKTLYDTFHKFIEYERAEETNTIDSYLAHEYSVINSLRAPKAEGGAEVAPADRFFTYKHYLDGNGELIDPNVMRIIARCMIRSKPDSYCQAHEVETRGISDLVQDLLDLYTIFGVHPAARPPQLGRLGGSASRRSTSALTRASNRIRWLWLSLLDRLRGKR
ncbi:MAG TPA: protein kinase [Polyangiaceae bacterium]